MKKLIYLLLLPLSVYANEAEIACNLEKSKAEVTASSIGSMQAFSTAGNETTSGDYTVVLGLRQSISGWSRAKTIREAAQEKCEAIKILTRLDQNAKWSLLEIQQESAGEELKVVEEAIVLAQDNISLLEKQLASKNITINQYTDAVNTLTMLEKKKAALEKILAVVIVKSSETSIQKLLEEARVREANAATLEAKATADTGWDIGVSLGSNYNITQNKADPMFGLYAKYSFGFGTATKEAIKVGEYTAALAQARENGHYQTILRQQKELEKIIEIEQNTADSSAKQMRHLNSIRSSIKEIDSELAANTLRYLNLQIKAMQADYFGAQQRRLGYIKLLDKLK